MPKSKAIDTVLAEAEQIARVWGENTDFALSGVTLKQFQTMVADLRTQSDKTEDLRTQLTASSNDTNTKALAVGDIVTRARGGFRAFFGPDSNQYEQAGGTRKSDRKRPIRKAKPGVASN
jgi:hypothetical protein